MGWPSVPRARADRSVWMPPNVFRGQDVHLHPDERAGAGVEDAMGCGGPTEPVAEVAPRVADALDLGVLGVGVGHLQITRLDLGADHRRVEHRLVGQRVHPPDEFVEVVRHDEVLAVLLERLHRGGCAPGQHPFPQERATVLGGDVGVLFGA
jgi:hypothetical protein